MRVKSHWGNLGRKWMSRICIRNLFKESGVKLICNAFSMEKSINQIYCFLQWNNYLTKFTAFSKNKVINRIFRWNNLLVMPSSSFSAASASAFSSSGVFRARPSRPGASWAIASKGTSSSFFFNPYWGERKGCYLRIFSNSQVCGKELWASVTSETSEAYCEENKNIQI